MSVQLGIRPQNELDLSYLNNMGYDYWYDGLNFNFVSSGTGNQETSNPQFVQNQINHFFTQTGGIQFSNYYLGNSPGTPLPSGTTIPTTLLFSIGHSCVIQKVNNIIVGANYLLRFEVIIYAGGTPPGVFKLHEYNGTTLVNTTTLSPLSTATNVVYQYIVNFQTATPTLVLEWQSSASILSIEFIELLNSVGQPASINFLKVEPEVLLDLYEDEDIPLTLSIDDFTKVAEKVQSYSKSFNIPETKRNKRAFDNIFEITRSDDGLIFNPYKKTEATLRVDGFIVFQGYLRLIDVNDKNGEVSYNINLYSEGIALKDYLGDLTIGDIDFNELEHAYNATNIMDSAHDSGTGIAYTNANTSGFRDEFTTLRYPFCDWKHQYTYDSDNMPVLDRLEDAFRPWIQCKYLINRIFENTPFTYVSSFFDSTDFEKLYMDFNWGDDGIPQAFEDNIDQRMQFNTLGTGSTSGLQTVPTAAFGTVLYLTPGFLTSPGGGYVQQTVPGLDYSTGVFTSNSDNMQVIITYDFAIRVTSGVPLNIFSQVNATIAGNPNQIINPVTQNIPAVLGTTVYQTAPVTTIINLDNLDSFKLEIKASASCNMIFTGYATPILPDNTSGNINFDISVTSVTSSSVIKSKRGEMKQWDFISGLLTMFNMVTIPNENYPQQIQFETWSDVFAKPKAGGPDLEDRNIKNDWTYKIDAQEIKLTPLTELNKMTHFHFVEDDDDHFANLYRKATRSLYGSKKFDASGASLLEGEEEIIPEPYAATVIKPLENYLNELIVPSICAFDNGAFKSFDNEPRILYNCGEVEMTNEHYAYPSQNGVSGSSGRQKYLQFSHFDTMPSTPASYDFVFESSNLFGGVGAPTLNNLFNLYWLPYLAELYNSDTRILTIKIHLTAAEINNFSFFDLVYIKQKIFRVNRIDYKPKDLSTVELIMLP
jgi:hypothetical protein